MESITSRSNPLCAHLRKLAASAAHRRESGEFLCDSPKLLEEVLLWRRELLRTVLCTDLGKLPELPEGTRVVVVPESLMEYLSPARTPQGVLSLCRKPEEALPETLPERPDLPPSFCMLLRKHLEDLGFVAGGTATVVAAMSGNIIVKVKEARVAISAEMARKIMV